MNACCRVHICFKISWIVTWATSGTINFILDSEICKIHSHEAKTNNSVLLLILHARVIHA